MKQKLNLIHYFSLGEWLLWGGSVAAVLLSFFFLDSSDPLKLAASLIGVTSLIFGAKGHPAGPSLMIVFCLIYGYISFSFRYYGEMLTYLGMSLPMCIVALAAWLKNPSDKGRSEVKVARLTRKEWNQMWILTVAVTVAFYVILKALGTANLLPSTLSVTTSFAAAYLTFRRSPYYCLLYAANDFVLIILWVLATMKEPSYLSVVICFAAFFVNDVYGFCNWKRMEKRQEGV